MTALSGRGPWGSAGRAQTGGGWWRATGTSRTEAEVGAGGRRVRRGVSRGRCPGMMRSRGAGRTRGGGGRGKGGWRCIGDGGGECTSFGGEGGGGPSSLGGQRALWGGQRRRQGMQVSVACMPAHSVGAPVGGSPTVDDSAASLLPRRTCVSSRDPAPRLDPCRSCALGLLSPLAPSLTRYAAHARSFDSSSPSRRCGGRG